jgi:hypothetical protein
MFNITHAAVIRQAVARWFYAEPALRSPRRRLAKAKLNGSAKNGKNGHA